MAHFRVLLAVLDSEPTIGKLTGVHLGIVFTLVLIVHMCAAMSAWSGCMCFFCTDVELILVK